MYIIAELITLNFNYKVLYAPSDFRDDKSFLKGLKSGSESISNLSDLDKDIGLMIKEFFTSEEFFEELNKDKSEETLKKAADKLSERIRDTSFFTVHLSTLIKTVTTPKTYPISLFRKFNGLTDAIYFDLHGAVNPFTYGKEWVLRNKKT